MKEYRNSLAEGKFMMTKKEKEVDENYQESFSMSMMEDDKIENKNS